MAPDCSCWRRSASSASAPSINLSWKGSSPNRTHSSDSAAQASWTSPKYDLTRRAGKGPPSWARLLQQPPHRGLQHLAGALWGQALFAAQAGPGLEAEQQVEDFQRRLVAGDGGRQLALEDRAE